LALFKVGDVLDLDISSTGSSGEGVGRIGDFVTFVPGALSGERVRVSLETVKRTYARSRLLEVLSPSPDRRDPPCPLFGRCGGCQLQHADYPLQLSMKRRVVQDAMRRIGGFEDPPVEPCEMSPLQWGYRNKAIVPVRSQGRGWGMGFYRPFSHEVVPLRSCPVMSDEINRVMGLIRDFLEPRIRGGLLSPYREGDRPSGSLREVVVRHGMRTGELLVSLVMRQDPRGRLLSDLEGLFRLLEGLGVVGLSVFRNRRDANFVWDGDFAWGIGRDRMWEVLGGMRLSYDVTSFFQVNTHQAERMFQHVVDLLDETGARDVLELYSGVGSLTGMIAAGGRRVVAVEEWPSAVEGLRENLQVNGIHGVTPLLGAAEDVLGDLGGDFQAVVLDPPRGGCHPEVIRAMVDAAVPHVIYVSCNPATLARDLMLLSQGGYVLRRVRPFDMFPQTCHVECVVLITKL